MHNDNLCMSVTMLMKVASTRWYYSLLSRGALLSYHCANMNAHVSNILLIICCVDVDTTDWSRECGIPRIC